MMVRILTVRLPRDDLWHLLRHVYVVVVLHLLLVDGRVERAEGVAGLVRRVQVAAFELIAAYVF